MKVYRVRLTTVAPIIATVEVYAQNDTAALEIALQQAEEGALEIDGDERMEWELETIEGRPA